MKPQPKLLTSVLALAALLYFGVYLFTTEPVQTFIDRVAWDAKNGQAAREYREARGDDSAPTPLQAAGNVVIFLAVFGGIGYLGWTHGNAE